MKKIKTLIINICKKNKLIRNISRHLLNLFRNIKYTFTGLTTKVDEKTLIFACFDGKKYVDSPAALYEQMLKDKKYKDYKYIWMFENPSNFKYLEGNPNTKLVAKGSKEYIHYLHVSKYWIFNYKIQDSIKPKKNQIFVQCWHGTPLKRLGCDLINYDNELNSVADMKKRYKKESQKFTYFISPSSYATKVFTSAWNLKEIGKEDIIIEKGYPRNDFLSTFKESDVKRIKKELNIPTNKKVILYAPTYRANQHTSGVGYTYKTELDFDKLQKEISDEYVILFRAHYFVANSFNFAKYKNFIYDVSNYNEINHLYIISDLLITDYSSVFFDYSILKRPMIFYMYDLEYYKNKSNGFYFDVEEELPGPIVKEEKDLIKEIKKAKNFKYDKKYQKFNEKYTYLDDGHVSERVLDVIIK